MRRLSTCWLRGFLWLVVAGIALCAQGQVARQRVSFDPDWRFMKGEVAGAAQPGFNDTAWRRLNLPHDFGVEGPFQQTLDGATGKLPWAGVAWYRKHFVSPASDAGQQVYLDIDGAMSHSTVWLNGEKVGGWPYGYTSFRVDLTPNLKVGGDNVLAIQFDNPPASSRWYPGGGIYRNVWLVKTSPLHVAYNGTFVTTPIVSPETALVDVQTTLEESGADSEAQVSTAIYALGADGHRIGPALATRSGTGFAKVFAGKQLLVEQTLTLERPKLWSLASPQRYVAVTTVSDKSGVVDEVESPFGIRTAVFDAEHGLMLNGKYVRIQGVCMHSDLGALGIAVYTRGLERQLEILHDMGVNAIRTSHNPPSPELLELADRMGFLIMDEAFDTWHLHKRRNDYATLFDDWHERDLRALIQRDRNHPSVVIWSIGNELPEEKQPEGWRVASELALIVRSEDRTRPVTAALNHVESGYDGFQTALNVMGYNYKPNAYEPFHASTPQIPVFGSETASTMSSRGEYFFPVTDKLADSMSDFQVSSFDTGVPAWATTPDVEFKAEDENPFVAGEFVWTGFDYLGEPTPYSTDATNLLNFSNPVQQQKAAQELAALKKLVVPSRSSYFGIVDLAGFKKDRFYLYQARWRPELPMAHLMPHWNWPERIGKVTPVQVYTSGDEAELFLNGKSLGRKKRSAGEYRLRWDEVVYQPGTLHVVAYRKGKHWAEDTVVTTGPPAKLKLSADRAVVHADGKDLVFLTLSVVDKDGRIVPRSKNSVHFTVSGPAELIATDNGDATSFVPFQSAQRAAFNGLALAIVRTEAGHAGAVVVTATSDNLETSIAKMQSR